MPQTLSFFIPRGLLLYNLLVANVFRFDQGRRRPQKPLGVCDIMDSKPTDLLEVRFNPEKASRGLFEEPQPPLERLSPVILVQRNDFLVGSWDEDCACVIHPANQRELAEAAESAVRAAFPSESFVSNTLRVFTCPPELASQFDWDWSKK